MELQELILSYRKNASGGINSNSGPVLFSIIPSVGLTVPNDNGISDTDQRSCQREFVLNLVPPRIVKSDTPEVFVELVNDESRNEKKRKRITKPNNVYTKRPPRVITSEPEQSSSSSSSSSLTSQPPPKIYYHKKYYPRSPTIIKTYSTPGENTIEYCTPDVHQLYNDYNRGWKANREYRVEFDGPLPKTFFERDRHVDRRNAATSNTDQRGVSNNHTASDGHQSVQITEGRQSYSHNYPTSYVIGHNQNDKSIQESEEEAIDEERASSAYSQAIDSSQEVTIEQNARHEDSLHILDEPIPEQQQNILDTSISVQQSQPFSNQQSPPVHILDEPIPSLPEPSQFSSIEQPSLLDEPIPLLQQQTEHQQSDVSASVPSESLQQQSNGAPPPPPPPPMPPTQSIPPSSSGKSIQQREQQRPVRMEISNTDLERMKSSLKSINRNSRRKKGNSRTASHILKRRAARLYTDSESENDNASVTSIPSSQVMQSEVTTVTSIPSPPVTVRPADVQYTSVSLPTTVENDNVVHSKKVISKLPPLPPRLPTTNNPIPETTTAAAAPFTIDTLREARNRLRRVQMDPIVHHDRDDEQRPSDMMGLLRLVIGTRAAEETDTDTIDGPNDDWTSWDDDPQ